PRTSPLFPYTTLFRSEQLPERGDQQILCAHHLGNAHCRIIYNHCELIRRHVIAPPDNKVSKIAAGHRPPNVESLVFELYFRSIRDRKSTRLNSSHDQI